MGLGLDASLKGGGRKDGLNKKLAASLKLHAEDQRKVTSMNLQMVTLNLPTKLDEDAVTQEYQLYTVVDKSGQRKPIEAMRRNQQHVRNHVSDSVEYGIDKLHRAADRCLVYPLAAIEGAIQGAARGVHNVVTHKHHVEYGATCGSSSHHGKCKCKSKSKSKPHCSTCGHPVGSSTPNEFYSYPPAPPPAPQFQYHHHPSFPVPCRPPC